MSDLRHVDIGIITRPVQSDVATVVLISREDNVRLSVAAGAWRFLSEEKIERIPRERAERKLPYSLLSLQSVGYTLIENSLSVLDEMSVSSMHA